MRQKKDTGCHLNQKEHADTIFKKILMQNMAQKAVEETAWKGLEWEEWKDF